MKRILAILLFLCIVFLCGCESDPEASSHAPGTSASSEGSSAAITEPTLGIPSIPATKPDTAPTSVSTAPSTTATAPTQPQTELRYYCISYSARLIMNNSVGNEWSYGASFNGEYISSDSTITATFYGNKDPVIMLVAVESDKAKDDTGRSSIALPDIAIGEQCTITETVDVRENDGRYSGNLAQWEFTVTIYRVGSPYEGPPDPPSFNGNLCTAIDTETGLPVDNVDAFYLNQRICIAGCLQDIAGENDVILRWNFPDGSTDDVSLYGITENDAFNTGYNCADLGSGYGSVSVILQSSGEHLATFYFTIYDSTILENVLYVEFNFPTTVHTKGGSIAVNTIEYYYIDYGYGSCSLWISIDILSQTDIYYSMLEFELVGCTSGEVYPYTVYFTAYAYEENCIILDEQDIYLLPVEDYYIRFIDYAP